MHPEVSHDDRPPGLPGYRAMLEADVRVTPDLRFEIGMPIAEPARVAARLLLTCTPSGVFLGVPVDGRTVTFAENVFYTYQDGRIAEVWSVIDKIAIEAQLRRPCPTGEFGVCPDQRRRQLPSFRELVTAT